MCSRPSFLSGTITKRKCLMKYIDRKNTPIKWHTFLKYVLPIVFVYTFYHTASSIIALFNENSYIAINLQLAGYSLNQMGVLFWPIIGSLLFELMEIILLLYACIGLWKWEIYGCKCLLIALNMECVSSIVYAVLLSRVPAFMLYMSSGMRIGGAYQTIWQNLLFASFIISAIIYFILFGLHFVYYRKRIALFDPYYMQPQYTSVQPDIFPSSMQEASASQIRFCQNCGAQITEEDAKFCPNCGEKL